MNTPTDRPQSPVLSPVTDHQQPQPPERFLFAVDDITGPMREALNALDFIGGLITLLAKDDDTSGQAFTPGAMEFFEEAIVKARRDLQAAYTRAHDVIGDARIVVPDPRFTDRDALALWIARKTPNTSTE